MKKIILLTPFLLVLIVCASRIKIKQDPFYESFFEKTRLIMIKEEIEIYKRLPDIDSKREFIEEFWRIRDPDLGTEENEGKIEFESRIEYANKWFGIWNPYRGRDTGRERDKYRGWNTDRGRMYIILGPPDLIIFNGWPINSREERRTEQAQNERWYYYRYNLSIGFARTTSGELRLSSFSSDLQYAIDDSKLNMVMPEFEQDLKRRFKFKAEFEDGKIIIRIPVTRIDFKEEEKKFSFKFKIIINIYHNHKKIEKIEETKDLEESEEELLRKNDIVLKIPFIPPLKGKYYFDIIVEDLMSMSISKYRSFLDYKHKKEIKVTQSSEKDKPFPERINSRPNQR